MKRWFVYPARHAVAFRECSERVDAVAPEPARGTAKETERRGEPASEADRKLVVGQQVAGSAGKQHAGSIASQRSYPDEQPLVSGQRPTNLEARGAAMFWLAPDDSIPPELLGEPELPFVLTEEELDEITDPGVVAGTHYGSTGQDKISNEDFALAAVIRLEEDQSFAFATIADGVSTKTFWAARTARIACFAAYKAVRLRLTQGLDLGGAHAPEDLASAVANGVRTAIEQDEKRLAESGAAPGGWDPKLYERHKGQRDWWYKSTLLYGVVGQRGGAIGYAGDGGIRGVILANGAASRELVERRFLHSVDGVELDQYVARGFRAEEITVGRFSHDGRRASHYILASDGIDKTLQGFEPNQASSDGLECHSRYRDLPLSTRLQTWKFLDELSNHPRVDLDNLSVARLSWPLVSRPDSLRRKLRLKTGDLWACWAQEPLSQWRSVEKLGPGENLEPMPPGLEYVRPGAQRQGDPAIDEALRGELRQTGIRTHTGVVGFLSGKYLFALLLFAGIVLGFVLTISIQRMGGVGDPNAAPGYSGRAQQDDRQPASLAPGPAQSLKPEHLDRGMWAGRKKPDDPGASAVPETDTRKTTPTDR